VTNLFRHASDATSIPAGNVVLQAGQPGDVMYVVVEGDVEIRLGDRVLERVGPGGFFGEMALVDHSPRSATAVAVTAARVVAIDEKRFLRMLQDTPGFALEVMRSLVHRLREMDAHA
jgi:CRP/FNR family transcriptional regulator, cyclic AMP receptor protein